MKSFARATKLPDIAGRGAYMTNPEKQEKVLAKSAPVDWEPYQRFEREHQKSAEKNNEGREMMVSLPNEWAKLREKELARRADHLARLIVGPDRDYQWAVHWNKPRTNLHVHIIYSERQRIADPGRWDRDIYLTEDGKVARRKADRAREPDGSFKPPIHQKGELKDGFTAKDTRFKAKGWLHEMKSQLRDEMATRWGAVFEQGGLLAEYHQGKGDESELISKKNEAIRATNRIWAEYLEAHPDISDSARKTFIETAKRERAAMTGRVTTIEWSPTMGSMVGTCSLEDWKAKEAQKAEEQAAETAKNAPQSVFERIKGGMSARAAKRAERAAQMAAEAEAKRAAEEQARKIAEEQAAAQRAAEAAARQQRADALAALKKTVEERWRTAEVCQFRGWQSIDAERALSVMREQGTEFPIIYRDQFGWRVQIFKADDWEQARSFASRTEASFNEARARAGGRPLSLDEQLKEIHARQAAQSSQREPQERQKEKSKAGRGERE